MAALPSKPALAAAQLAACYAVALFHRTCGAVLLLPLAASFDVAPHALTGITIVFFWVYALLQLPSGVLADMLGSRRLAIAGCVAMGTGALAFGLSKEVWIAISARGLIAAGSAVIFVSMVRHVKASWTADRVATMTGRGILVGNLGTIASSAPLAIILLCFDWRTLSVALGSLSLALALGLWFSTADAREPHVGRARLRMVLPQIGDVLTNRSNHFGLVVLGGLAGSYLGVRVVVGVAVARLRRHSRGDCRLERRGHDGVLRDRGAGIRLDWRPLEAAWNDPDGRMCGRARMLGAAGLRHRMGSCHAGARPVRPRLLLQRLPPGVCRRDGAQPSSSTPALRSPT